MHKLKNCCDYIDDFIGNNSHIKYGCKANYSKWILKVSNFELKSVFLFVWDANVD